MKKIKNLFIICFISILFITFLGSCGSNHVHDYTSEVIEPTCEGNGYTKHFCSCGDTYNSDIIKSLGHKEVIDEAVKSTCTEFGLTDGSHCSECGEILVKQEVIDMISCFYVDGLCIYCNNKEMKNILEYTLLEDGTYEVKRIIELNKPDVVIPSTYDGHSVTSIGEGAFIDCINLTSVTIPNTITRI